ncbi:hypothetical protein O7543_19100 [Solwaraspora sp. WMMA2080]|uniref:hypothetical protein n=1 Tax=unclassified Solwaraspora TaxID=2627926 RepID=UPI00248C7D95|nr:MULTISPECIES: hypothetical protein [unclassified Solwaraspora]WBB97111.1 hypothetical protein O7553_28270 [Solwaraspora sp. WMMA2059]WBC18987.1 hypothetical protein O7543_19100 [Solwaraspora sp. WMMA2080]
MILVDDGAGESGPNADADDAGVTRECETDEAAEVALTLRWSFEDLKAEHGEAGARRIVAEILARWQANGGEPVSLDDA